MNIHGELRSTRQVNPQTECLGLGEQCNYTALAALPLSVMEEVLHFTVKCSFDCQV